MVTLSVAPLVKVPPVGLMLIVGGVVSSSQMMHWAWAGRGAAARRMGSPARRTRRKMSQDEARPCRIARMGSLRERDDPSS
jgi:hypothetical protein